MPLPNGLMTVSAGSRSVRFVMLVTGAGVVDELTPSLVIYKYTNNQLHVNHCLYTCIYILNDLIYINVHDYVKIKYQINFSY